MSGGKSNCKRQWRDYQTVSGTRPVKDFLFTLPDADRAAILEEMEHIRKYGKSVARHIHKDIHEVRVIYNTNAYRILRRLSEKDTANTPSQH